MSTQIVSHAILYDAAGNPIIDLTQDPAVMEIPPAATLTNYGTISGGTISGATLTGATLTGTTTNAGTISGGTVDPASGTVAGNWYVNGFLQANNYGTIFGNFNGSVSGNSFTTTVFGSNPAGFGVGWNANQDSGDTDLFAMASSSANTSGTFRFFANVSPSSPTTMQQIGSWDAGGNLSAAGNITASGYSLPFVIANANVTVTSTGTVTILSVDAPYTGQYALMFALNLSNGTSGNDISFDLDVAGTGYISLSLFELYSTLFEVASGSTSFENGQYYTYFTLSLNAGTTFAIAYQDPTNTPNDTVWATLLYYHA